MPPTVLLVDDEELFLRTAVDGLYGSAPEMKVLTARNGRLAVDLLAQYPVDLVITDLKMPEMDGYGLLAHLSRHHPTIPAIVMTAFGTPEIEDRLHAQGIPYVLDKPFDFNRLQDIIREALSATASGHLSGISLATFLQMIEMEKKTCVVRVQSHEGQGLLHFREGQLVHAQNGDLTGDAAALAILAFDEPDIELIKGRSPHPGSPFRSLVTLLMEAFRLRDESRKRETPSGDAAATHGTETLSRTGEDTESPPMPRSTTLSHTTKESPMTALDKLKELAQIEGFAGCGLFTPAGEPLAVLDSDGTKLKEIGVLANNVLMNAQKASLEMGAGRGQQVHVEAEQAHILVRCLNEGTDPLRSMPGKAHIHLVLILKSDASIGMANNVLMNAQKASLEMGAGRGQQVHVEAEQAHILVRCLNEGTDPLRSMPGKAHIHLVLILKSDASIGMAKLRISSVIAGLAELFRA